jgi:methylenetetrahydrofolate reductase (NADPH)
MSFREALETQDFTITCEVAPPKGVDMKHVLEEAELLRGRVAGLNVTDLQAAAMRVSSVATCAMLKQMDLEPILQMVCRDRNRIALQSDLLSAYTLGIRNVLCLTGDHVLLGDHPEAKPVFDLDSVSLLRAAQGLIDGHDLSGNELEGTPDDLFLGAIVTPGADPVEPQIYKLHNKVEAGARFIQTQAVYDVDQFAAFMEKVSDVKVPILAGIVLLKSAGMARYMNANVAGVFVPDDLIKEMAAAGKKDKEAKAKGEKGGNVVRTSIEIAGRLIRGLRPHCAGVHLMPLGWGHHVPAVLEAAEL